jgi:hypothetical protein
MLDISYIYSLSDPRNGEVRYIGKANSLKKRLGGHLRKDNKDSHKDRWIKSLRVNGLLPVMEIIDEVSVEDWEFWEIYWIAQFKQWGFKLTNSAIGGQGSNFVSQTTKDKLSSRSKGIPKSEKHRKNISNGRKGIAFSEEHRKNIGISSKGRIHTQETKQLIILANKGKKQSKERIEKRLIKIRGRKNSEASILLMRKAKLGKKFSEETKALMTSQRLGVKRGKYNMSKFNAKKLEKLKNES